MFVLWASIMHCLFTCRRRVGGYRAPAEFCEKRTIDGNFLRMPLSKLLTEGRFGGSAHDKGILPTGSDRVLVREMQLWRGVWRCCSALQGVQAALSHLGTQPG